MMHQLPNMPMMGLAPISPMIGALPWATTAKGTWIGAVVGCVVVAVAAAVDTATASPHIDIAAFVAAPNNITYNIACMFHTKQYLYPYQYVYGWVYHHLLYWYVYIDMELVLLMEMKRIWWRRFDDMVMELVMILMMVKWMVMRISKYSKHCHVVLVCCTKNLLTAS